MRGMKKYPFECCDLIIMAGKQCCCLHSQYSVYFVMSRYIYTLSSHFGWHLAAVPKISLSLFLYIYKYIQRRTRSGIMTSNNSIKGHPFIRVARVLRHHHRQWCLAHSQLISIDQFLSHCVSLRCLCMHALVPTHPKIVSRRVS